MNSVSQKQSLPLEIMVVEYVAGNLSDSARKQFEDTCRNNPELIAQVEEERAFRAMMLNSDNKVSAGDNFAGLIDRIEEFSQVENEITETSSTTAWPKLQIAASISMAVAALGMLAAIGLNQSVKPEFQGLSSSNEAGYDVPSLASQNRLTRIRFQQGLNTDQVNQLLAAYQLRVVSHLPEQSSVLVFADQSLTEQVLRGLEDDSRIVEAKLVKIGSVTE